MIDIRSAEAADAEAIAAVILPIQRDEFGIPIRLEDQPDLGDIRGFYQNGCGNFWVAAVDGRIVGTIALLDIGKHEAALRKMFVAAPFRGREHGVAQRLLDHLLVWAALGRVARIFLGTTAKFLAAHRFYEKNGFTEIVIADLPANFPVMAVDTRFYRLVLSPSPGAG
jgi:N-acetylglutamate synthase-like GNAT family acetyltransferase